MSDVLLGIFAVLAGLLFCFRGYLAMRVVIPIWGAFAGFMLGAGAVANITDEGFLASVLGWIVGGVVGLLFAAFAYLYYAVAVVISLGAIGFAIGTGVMTAIGVTWSWMIVLVGVAVGLILAILAIVGDLPMTLLVALTALGGASGVVTGLLLLFGVITVGDFQSEATTRALQDDWWWFAIYAGLAVAGMIAQFRSIVSLKMSLREAWVESGGRQVTTG